MKSFLMRLVACAAVGFAAFAAEAAVSVRLLFVYDKGAQDYLSQYSLDAYSVASKCVTQMNNVLANSRLTGTDNLTQQSNDYFSYTLAGVSYVQAQNSNTATAWSQAYNVVLGNTAESDVSMDGLLEERARYAADIIVMLIYRSGGADGNSTPYQGTDEEYAVNFAGKAVSVVDVEMAVAEGSGAFGAFQICSHEVAHTLGCGHSDTQDTQSGQQSSSYSFGYQFDYPGEQNYTLYQNNSYQAWWGCTVMAYKEHFFKNSDGTFMSAEDVLALTGWTDADDREHLWNNFDGSYGTTYAKGIWNYCNMLPYFSSPDLCFVTNNSSAATVVPTSWATAHYDAGTYVLMGNATHNNRQVLIDNCGYASRWHLGVKFTKAGDASVVNGKADKITLSSLSDNCSVYYTTDGTEPTKTNGTLYSAPISLTQTTTIKARSYDANDNAGDVFTREYTVLPLATALGNTALTWTTSSPAWYVDGGVARSGVISSDGVTSTLSTVITGPATLSFEYRTELMDSDVFNVTVGSESVFTATDYNSDWRSSGEISIPEGSQTVTFSFTVNQNLASINNAAVCNVSVVYANDPSEEPDDPTPAEPTYDGPTPTATWVTGEFDDDAADHGGYSIDRDDNAVNDDGNIVIGSSTVLGAVIDIASVTNCTKVTILAKIKTPTGGAPVANSVVAGVLATDNHPVGAACKTAGGTDIQGYWLNGSNANYNNDGYKFGGSLQTLSEGEAYMLFAYQSDPTTINPGVTGTSFYIGASLDEMSGGNVSGLQWRGYTNNVVSVGGPASAVTSMNTVPWAGLEIKAVALFVDEWLSPEDIAGYEFPEAKEYVPTWAKASVTTTNGETVYYTDVLAALNAVANGQVDGKVVKVYDGTSTDYSAAGFAYDPETQTYTLVATAIARVGNGIVEVEFATLAEACQYAEEEGFGSVTLLAATSETIPSGWSYVSPADSGTTYGELLKIVSEIPGTTSRIALTQENVSLSIDGEWAEVSTKPIYITLGSATNAFTLSFDADIPDGMYGTLLSWDSVLGTTTLDSRVVITNDAAKQVIWRKADGTLSTVEYAKSELIQSGEHYIELNWVHNSGATIKVDGAEYYSSSNLKFSNYTTTKFALGGSALGSPDDVLAGLKVKNLNFRVGKQPTEPDEESENFPRLGYVTRLDGTIYHGNDENRAIITNWQTQITGIAKRPVPEGKADADFKTIDLLFVYDTPGKAYVESNESAWNGASALEVYSAKATAKMNQILCTTDIDTNFWFRMVGVHTVDGTGGTLKEILGKCEGLTGEYTHMLELRDRYGADVIVCPSPYGGGFGGLARLNTLDEIKSRGQNAAYHFATVLLNYSQTHAWVHEIGHNMSLNHYPPANFDPANTWRGLGFQHKIAVDGTSMSSVMAELGYADFCGGFSSKNHIYHGSRLSISNHLDSTGVLLEAAPYVSQWRSTRIPETQEIKCSVTYGSSLPGDTEFELSFSDPEAEIWYQVFGLNNDFVKYTKPFTVPESAGSAYISAYVVKDGVSSATNIVNFSAFSSTWDTLLGSPRLPWAIYKSIDGGWAAASGEEYLEVADSFTGSRTSESTLSTTVVGPDTLSFEHSELLKDNYYHNEYPHSYPESTFTVWVDNEPVYMLRGATNTLESWTTTEIAIPEGTHKVDFTYSHRSGYVSGETVRIKSVALASAQEPEDPPVDEDEYAVEPAAVWCGDFKTTTKNGYTLSTSGTTAIADDTYGSTITIGDSAATIAIPEPTRQYTMLVKYSAAPAQTAQNFFAGGSFTNGASKVDIGLLSTSSSSSALTAGYDNGSAVTAKAIGETITPSTTGGYILIAHDAGGNLSVYAGDTFKTLTTTSATIDYKFTNWYYTSLAVGGPSGVLVSNKCGAWDGLVLEKVAIFDGYYTPGDLIVLENPEDAATLEIAAGATWNFAAGTTRTYENIGTLSASGTIAVTNETVGVGVYKLAEWTTAQKKSTGYGYVGTLSTQGLVPGLTAELVYGAKAIYLRVYDADEQAAKGTLKVWPYGDSITEGFNAGGTRANYRVLLGQKLSMLGYNVEMVGCYDKINGADAIDPSGQVIPDAWKWHSAKHGATAGPTTSAKTRANLCENVDTLCAQAGNPDVVLLLAGANDIVPATGLTAQQVVSSITNIVAHLAANLPNAKIVVGNQLNVESGYTSYNYDHVTNMIPQVNTRLKSYVDDLPTELSGRVFLADLNSYVKSGEYGILFDQSGDHLHPDWWGHDQMAEGWLSVITNQFTSTQDFPSATIPEAPAAEELGAAAKSELDAYREGFALARTIDVANMNAPSVVDGEGVKADIEKVGYFVEYVRADNNAHKWVWVDMDAFGTTIADVGLPAANHQQVVAKLHVKSNHNGIDNVAADDDTVTGFVEFSPCNYGGNASGVTGAPDDYGSCCDWNDTLSTSGTYGCMQVHRIFSPAKSAADGIARGGQVLFAYNNWQSDSTAAEFGIGNFSSHFYRGASDAQTLDYTYTANATKMNAAAYSVKRIEIWTKAANVQRITVADGETATVDDYQPGVTYIISGAGTVAFTQLPEASSLSFGDWTGTLELPAFRADGQVLTDYVVNGVSKLKLNGITGGYLMWNDLDFQSELVLAGDFVLTDMSARDYSFAKISGTGNISLSPGTYELKSFAIGEYSASGIVSNSMSATAIAIGTLALPEGTSVAGGTRLLATGGTGAVSVENVTVGGVAQSISLVNGGEGDEAGFYVEDSSATATVVRVHPRLTRGLAREALLGIRFDNSLGGNASAFDVKFRLVNCTKADITDIKYWKQPYTHNYGFYEAEATQGPTATVSAADDATEFTASFPAGSVWFYPQVGTREDSDYLWVTATINPEISPDAEILVSVPTEKITLSNGGTFNVVNGAETQPHRVFPFVHQIGAYLRQDGTALTGTWAGKLEDSPANRVGNLTDIVVCNDFLVAYDSENDTFKTTWDARRRDNTAQVARIKALRDQYNPKCMIRASLTKGEGTITVDGVTGRPIACAAASAARRKQLIDSILAVMESAGLDGLDIDWEYPGDHDVTTENTQRDWHSYGLLMRDLAAAFFDKGYVLSFCSNLGYQMAPDGYHAAFHAADFINAMAYGNTTLNASPHVMQIGINVCTSRGVPPRRIVVGQAMYAYEVQNPGWGTVVKWLKDKWPSDKTRWWDADLIWMDRSVTNSYNTVISTDKETFEGPSSYHAKCNWCRANGYGGVMSWGYFTDVLWDDADLMSLSRHQAKSCWPRENWSWPTPQDSDGAYLLDSEEDWFWLRDNPGVNARFAADIALVHDPLPIETFSGTIDGAGHTLTISNDVWLAYDSNPALVRTLTGTVKDLKIDLYGRVVSRASRWNDTTTNTTANTLASGTHNAAVLAANLGAGGVIDGVELFIRPGAEVQGPQRVAGLAASVWVANDSYAEIRNSSVHIDGVVRSLARNTAEGDITVANQCAGGLAGWVACPGARNIVVTNNIVSLASTGRVAVETGSSSSAGGVIGDLNNVNPLVQSNAVYVASGATVSANESAAAEKVRTSYANASYSISSSANAGQTTFFIEDGAATLAGSVGGKSDATVKVSSYDGGAATDGISVDAVAGFWYSVIYGDELVPGGIGGATGETAPVKAAASGPLTLDAPKSGEKRFYRVKVAPVAE